MGMWAAVHDAFEGRRSAKEDILMLESIGVLALVNAMVQQFGVKEKILLVWVFLRFGVLQHLEHEGF